MFLCVKCLTKETCTRQFWKIEDKRPQIRSTPLPISTIPGTFVRIRPKKAYEKFFEGVFCLVKHLTHKEGWGGEGPEPSTAEISFPRVG